MVNFNLRRAHNRIVSGVATGDRELKSGAQHLPKIHPADRGKTSIPQPIVQLTRLDCRNGSLIEYLADSTQASVDVANVISRLPISFFGRNKLLA